MASSNIENVELVMWSQIGKPPIVTDVRMKLVRFNYKPDYAEDIPDTTSFRRAACEFQSKDMKVTIWTKDEAIFGQLDKLEPDEKTKRVKRIWQASWEMVFDAEKKGFVTADSGGEFRVKVTEAKNRYVWGDVSAIIQRILKEDGLGAYSLRKAGAVYVVPTTSKYQLDNLEAFCDAVGLKFLRYKVPDTLAQKMEIASAISDALDAECDAHLTAIEAYANETKPGHIENRLTALESTRALVVRLNEYLGAKAATLNERLDALKNQTEAKLQAAQSYRPHTNQGRRIIAGVGASA
jgi:hypothetical protein